MGHIRQQVALEDLRFYAYHGYYPEEQVLGNEFVVAIRVVFERHASGSDELVNTINYEKLYQIAKDEMKIPRKLLETVADSILSRLRGDFSFICEAEVQIIKNNPPFGGDRAKASVILSWSKPD